MNERIAELIVEAGKTIPGDKHIDADFCNKFAELLEKEFFSAGYQAGRSDGIRETALECIDNIRQNMEYAKVESIQHDPTEFKSILKKSGHFFITELEQHFGVES